VLILIGYSSAHIDAAIGDNISDMPPGPEALAVDVVTATAIMDTIGPYPLPDVRAPEQHPRSLAGLYPFG